MLLFFIVKVHECVIINTSNIELNVTQKHQQKKIQS